MENIESSKRYENGLNHEVTVSLVSEPVGSNIEGCRLYDSAEGQCAHEIVLHRSDSWRCALRCGVVQSCARARVRCHGGIVSVWVEEHA